MLKGGVLVSGSRDKSIRTWSFSDHASDVTPKYSAIENAHSEWITVLESI
jgi:hypothetical protein